MRLKLTLFALLCLTQILFAKDLWLKAKADIASPFVRLSAFVTDEASAEKLNKVFLGRVSAGKEREITLEYISERLASNGFLALVPKVIGGLDHITVRYDKSLAREQKKKAKAKALAQNSHEKKVYKYLTLTERLKSGEPVTNNIVVLKAYDMPNDKGVKKLQDVKGMHLKRSLRAGTLLESGHLYLPPTISRGDAVKISIEQPSMTITAIGTAMEDGFVGDTIKVRRKRETLMCQISGKNTVMVSSL